MSLKQFIRSLEVYQFYQAKNKSFELNIIMEGLKKPLNPI